MASFIDGLGDLFTGGNQSRSANLAKGAADEMIDVDTPTLDPLQLEDMVSAGVITPEQAQVYAQSPSAMNGVSTDPKLQQAQMDALNSLKGISDSGGMTAADKANLSQIASNEATQQRGSREAILQNAQARGLGGSGLELMAQLQNQQDSATRQNQRDLDVTGQAQARALQALQSAGQLGGQMQAAQFGQRAQVAQANDAINQFNTQNRQNVGLYNNKATNDAQAANVTAAQNLSNANTGLHNTQTQYNTQQLPQQQFDNDYKRSSGVANAMTGQANNATQAGAQNAQVAGSGLQALGTLGGAIITKSDERSKENIEPFDASKFLDSLTSYKYNYKTPEKDGAGTFAGPMAQDLEKTPEGDSLVMDTPEGKKVDYGKGFGTILAALTDVHNRVKNLEGDK